MQQKIVFKVTSKSVENHCSRALQYIAMILFAVYCDNTLAAQHYISKGGVASPLKVKNSKFSVFLPSHRALESAFTHP